MKKIFVCKYCGSGVVCQDATYVINSGGYRLHDEEWCECCGRCGCDVAREVEVPNEFNVFEDTFDVSELNEES
jgi:hypothetical protein